MKLPVLGQNDIFWKFPILTFFEIQDKMIFSGNYQFWDKMTFSGQNDIFWDKMAFSGNGTNDILG